MTRRRGRQALTGRWLTDLAKAVARDGEGATRSLLAA